MDSCIFDACDPFFLGLRLITHERPKGLDIRIPINTIVGILRFEEGNLAKGVKMLMRTDPFRQLDRLAEVFGTPMRPAAMPIDAYQKDHTFFVQFDLPGVDARSIDLTVEKNVLTVHAQRSRSIAEDSEILLAERPQGNFSRQLFLGDTLDTENIAAEYLDGVLTLRIPVAESAKPRKVAISTADQEPVSIGS
jgi:HSP20 family protein